MFPQSCTLGLGLSPLLPCRPPTVAVSSRAVGQLVHCPLPLEPPCSDSWRPASWPCLWEKNSSIHRGIEGLGDV